MAADATPSAASEKFARTLILLLLASTAAFIGAVFVFVL